MIMIFYVKKHFEKACIFIFFVEIKYYLTRGDGPVK
jgi:hypothetical protein